MLLLILRFIVLIWQQGLERKTHKVRDLQSLQFRSPRGLLFERYVYWKHPSLFGKSQKKKKKNLIRLHETSCFKYE